MISTQNSSQPAVTKPIVGNLSMFAQSKKEICLVKKWLLIILCTKKTTETAISQIEYTERKKK
jgi:hypothetical protein